MLKKRKYLDVCDVHDQWLWPLPLSITCRVHRWVQTMVLPTLEGSRAGSIMGEIRLHVRHGAKSYAWWNSILIGLDPSVD